GVMAKRAVRGGWHSGIPPRTLTPHLPSASRWAPSSPALPLRGRGARKKYGGRAIPLAPLPAGESGRGWGPSPPGDGRVRGEGETHSFRKLSAAARSGARSLAAW